MSTFDAGSANASLLRAYHAAWPALTAVLDRTPGASGAHLVRIPDAFADARVRLAVVGQETMGWDRRDSAEAQRSLYPADATVVGKRHTPFWRAARELADAVGECDDAPFLWANLVPADVLRKQAPPDVRDALREAAPPHGLLRHVLEAARPDVVVFLTGPSGYYAYEMEQQFPGLDQIDVEGFDRRALVRLRHEALPAASFRTYHPNYLRRTRRWEIVSTLAAESRSVLAGT